MKELSVIVLLCFLSLFVKINGKDLRVCDKEKMDTLCSEEFKTETMKMTTHFSTKCQEKLKSVIKIGDDICAEYKADKNVAKACGNKESFMADFAKAINTKECEMSTK